MRSLIAAAAFAAFAAGPSHAVTAVIDFETESDDIIIDEVSAGGATALVSAFRTTVAGAPNAHPNNPLAFDVVGFDTNRGQTNASGDPDLLFPFDGDQGNGVDGGAANPFGIVAVLLEQGETADDGDPANDRFNQLPGVMRFVFDKDIELLSLAALDFEEDSSLRVFLDGLEITANAANNGVSGNNGAATWAPDAPTGFGRQLDIVFNSSGAIDNIKVNVIPLPAGAWLLLSGFGFVVGAQRWRKQRAA
ncbi:MAG: VPLPA-CTERM sorting domain-containing protein [Pseudomonadota bacterium]